MHRLRPLLLGLLVALTLPWGAYAHGAVFAARAGAPANAPATAVVAAAVNDARTAAAAVIAPDR
ncbi:hypothetical protein, partial [Oceaniglobus roseus]|uniref:hypothetical protein n=1 Tax=Oceaniglobus roseus TaxID=1737570 RepID=UPI001C129B54